MLRQGQPAETQAERDMKQPPTERHRAIAQRRADGLTFAAVGDEFGLRGGTVQAICRRVEDYDRGAAKLRHDPASIEALSLLGKVKPLVRITLASRGVTRLTHLEGLAMVQLLRYPNIGRQSATFLFDALAELKKSS